MKIEFITEPDCMGKGRVIVDGRFYGLPLAAVMQILEWRAIALKPARMDEYVCPECGYPGKAA